MTAIIKELLRSRYLIQELVIKDLKLRYSRPLLGFFWAFLSPFLIVIIFYLVFSLILKVEIRGVPFIFYLMSAVFPWRFFQDSLICSVTSLIDNKNLIRESNFAHYLIPVSIVLVNMIIFFPPLLILIIVSLWVLKGLGIFIIFLPIILAIHIIITVASAIISSILYVKWRDTKYILEILLLLLFYLTPAFYPLSLVRTSFPPLLFRFYLCNPLVCILNLYRISIFRDFYSIIRQDISDLTFIIILPVIFAISLVLLAIYLYRKNKDSINDYLSY